MRKLTYEQVRNNINYHLKTSGSDDLIGHGSTNFNCLVLGLIDSINENIDYNVREDKTEIPDPIKTPKLVPDLLNLDGVEKVMVFENATGIEQNNLPIYSFECIVEGGDPKEIAAVIMNMEIFIPLKPVGIIEAEAIDRNGTLRKIRFSRPNDSLSELL